jgi:hypothetical protein
MARPKGSRNKNTAEIKAMAQEHGSKALKTLIKLLDSPNESTRIAAADRLLDRGYGRSVNQTQTLDASGNVTEEISNMELAPPFNDLQQLLHTGLTKHGVLTQVS